MNFRSAPLLVRVQNSLIKSLLNKTDFATHSSKWKGDEGECLIWEFEDQTREAAYLVKAISLWIHKDKLDPREICILVKGSLAKYVAQIIDSLKSDNINARDESIFQDFLTDEVILYLVHAFYMVIDAPKIESKTIVFSFLSRVNNELSDQQLLKLENRLAYFIKQQKAVFQRKTFDQPTLDELVRIMIDYANTDRIRAIFPQYKQSSYLTKMLSDLKKVLGNYLISSKSFKDALDQFCGLNTIPIMTVHKSKGL